MSFKSTIPGLIRCLSKSIFQACSCCKTIRKIKKLLSQFFIYLLYCLVACEQKIIYYNETKRFLSSFYRTCPIILLRCRHEGEESKKNTKRAFRSEHFSGKTMGSEYHLLIKELKLYYRSYDRSCCVLKVKHHIHLSTQHPNTEKKISYIAKQI